MQWLFMSVNVTYFITILGVFANHINFFNHLNAFVHTPIIMFINNNFYFQTNM